MTPLWKIAFILLMVYLGAVAIMRVDKQNDALREEVGQGIFTCSIHAVAVIMVIVVFGGLWLWGLLVKWLWG